MTADDVWARCDGPASGTAVPLSTFKGCRVVEVFAIAMSLTRWESDAAATG